MFTKKRAGKSGTLVFGGGLLAAFVMMLAALWPVLERRLHARAQDSDAVIGERMARAKSEIGHWDGYDYVLINDDVERCFAQVRQILTAERLKRRRQKGLIGFVRDLVAS